MIDPQVLEHHILIPAILVLLAVLSLFDLLTRRIPLPLNLALLAIAAFRAVCFGKSFGFDRFSKINHLQGNFLPSVIPEDLQILQYVWFIPLNALIGFFFFFLIRKLTKNGLGLGDAILSSSMAVLLGLRRWLAALALASATALLYFGVKYLIARKGGRGSRIPFAPFLSLATFFLIL